MFPMFLAVENMDGTIRTIPPKVRDSIDDSSGGSLAFAA